MKRFRALTFTLLLLASNAFAAVARDAVTSGQRAATPGATLTVSHTVTTGGANRAIYVLCALDDQVITLTATYAGAAMTEVIRNQHATLGVSSWIFRKTNPATGANNWVVTQSAGEPMICWALSATGVNQTTPETDSDGTCPAAGTSSTLTLTTATGELLLDILALAATDATNVTAGADQTQEMLLEQGTQIEATGSRQAGADGGVMSQSWTNTQSFCYSAVSIKAAPVGAIAPVFFP